MLSWLGSLLATVVVWPLRAVTGRWPVIAYVVNPYDGDNRQQRTPPLRRAEADVLVHQWAEYIEQHGQPPPGNHDRRF